MPRICIIKANELNTVHVSNGRQHADVAIDGKFHPIHEDLIPVLTDSAVEFEVEDADELLIDAPEIENVEPARGTGAADGADGLGGLAASSPLHEAADRMEALAAKVSAA